MKTTLLIATLAACSLTATAESPHAKSHTLHAECMTFATSGNPGLLLKHGDRIKEASTPAGVTKAVKHETGAPLTVPWSNDFSSPDISAFTIIDGDNDDRIWEYDSENECMKSGSTKSGVIDKDDWLITPGLLLEKGKVYTISMDLWRRSARYEERAEVWLGSAPTAAGMTRVLLERTKLQEDSPKEYTFEVTVQETGAYYIGIHAVSEPLRWTMYADNIKVDCTSSESAPAAIADFAPVADIHGAAKVDITFTAPSTTYDNGQLTSISKIEISRDGTVIKTFENPAPGTALTYTDDPVTEGMRVYTVTASNGAGQSQPVSEQVYVGFTTPKAPAKATITEDPEMLGMVKVAWEPVTEDIYGKIYPEGTVTYFVADATSIVQRDITGTSIDVHAVPEGQDFAYYGVFTRAGRYGQSAEYANTGMIPVGEPYAIPFYESAPGADLSFHWGKKNLSEESNWGTLDLESSGGSIDAFDGDGGYIGSLCKKSGDRTRLMSGKVDISSAKNPYLRFAYWAWEENDKPETIIVMAREAGDPEEFATIATFYTTAPKGKGGWQRVFIPLDAYKGKTIQIAFETVMGNHFYTMFDAITLYNVHDHDLAVTGIVTPSRVKTAETHEVTAEIENRGVNTESDYTIDLLLNGQTVKTLPGTPISLGEYRTFTFTNELGVNNPKECEYKVRVNVDGDGNLDDNESETKVTFLTLPNYPTVPGLNGSVDESTGNVLLTWETPDTSRPKPEPTFDSFEDYESFAIDNVGDWTMHDLDGEENYVIEDNEFPHNGEAFSFIVLDTRRMQTPYQANSGVKAMVSFPSTKNGNNDWLITPMLWDGEQEITFFAKSHIGLYGLESFDVLYSTAGTSPYEFTRIGGEKEVPTTWTRYTYTVPEGTKYFAVRCTSKNMLAFMVDDFEFLSASSPLPDLTIKGYNVYRDMIRLNTEPIAGNTFTDNQPMNRQHTYHVSAVYNAGESQLSDPCDPFLSGIDTIEPDTAGTAVKVFGMKGAITVTGADGSQVDVFNATGALVFSCSGRNSLTVTVNAGVYMVKVNGTTHKVLVR